MICYALKFSHIIPFFTQSFDARGLEHGAKSINEPYVRPDCIVDGLYLAQVHEGKDASIMDMLKNGNGYPYHNHNELFDLGCTEERRDIRALLIWQSSLDQCLFDRKRGATE